jgi:hypothetical protein
MSNAVKDLSRRSFLQGLAGAPLLASKAARPHLRFPSDARKRLAVTSYPFRTFIESPTNSARDKTVTGMDLKEFPGTMAKLFGINNINPLGDHLRSPEPAYLEEFRKAVADAQSHVVDLGLAGQDFGQSDKAKRDEAVAFGRRWIDIAAVIGSPSVRQHLRTAQGQTPSVANTVESLSRLADYGSQKDIVVNLENDSPGAEDPFFIAEVVHTVNSPYLRALPDFGRALGTGAEASGLRSFAPRAARARPSGFWLPHAFSQTKTGASALRGPPKIAASSNANPCLCYPTLAGRQRFMSRDMKPH